MVAVCATASGKAILASIKKSRIKDGRIMVVGGRG